MVLKTPGELRLMDEANGIVLRVLDALAERIRPGVTTRDLDRFAEAMIREAGAVPAFLDYKGYPASLCTSINDVIVHGIPDATALREGDIIGIDCGVLYNGYFGAAARTYSVGAVSEPARRLIATTRAALELAIEQVRPGGRLSDVGHAVQQHVEGQGFSVVRDFVGHGIGTALHEDPQVPNFGEPGRGPRMKAGLVLAIEPMVNAGKCGVRMDADGWTARTEDGSLSAHFEYSVAVTEDGPWVLGLGGRPAALAAQDALAGARGSRIG
ncbi:MAG: type I methionyl aminopeptidase [Acidobacteria bacterium RBG_16_64_8]|nr:MAG: type I methionyl aminopeptidase [Acidobacteria bacterium RBG_16_64_8]